MQKKLIGFTTELQEHIEIYAKENRMNFSEAVRFLVEKGLGLHISSDTQTEEGDSIDIITVWKELQKLQKETGWFKADDTQHKLENSLIEINNIKESLEEMDKKINVVTRASKLFKKHIDNRAIHMQD